MQHITLIELANVKRVKALRLVPSTNGLTIIGGKNAAGKTSVLDAIAYAFGGEKYRPSQLKRDGAVGDALIHIETDDGMVIERKGAKAALTITDPSGKRAGQTILDSMISKIAIDLPKFLNASDSEKAGMLLSLLGVADELKKLDEAEKAKYDTRTLIGRDQSRKAKAVEELPYYEGLPEKPVLVADLIKEQQAILARNNQRVEHKRACDNLTAERNRLCAQVEELKKRIEAVSHEIQHAIAACEVDGEAESTAELEKQIANAEEINQKILANEKRTELQVDADALAEQYDTLTKQIEEIRTKRIALLNKADLPLPGLSVDNGCLTLNGKSWDCMSSAQQLIVACSIAAKLNPTAKFVLLDKLEQLDPDTLANFNSWLEERDLQAIATRVSTGKECAVIIEDGEAVSQGEAPVIPAPLSDEDI